MYYIHLVVVRATAGAVRRLAEQKVGVSTVFIRFVNKRSGIVSLQPKIIKKMFLFGTAAHLGFYKGGCPIHLKGAPEVEHRRRRGRWGMGKELCPLRRFFFVFLVSKL